jgi:DNA (cytosine-5)-methyltransferase 1
LENVYGAITSHGGEDFDAIIVAIAELGYSIGAMVIDAVHFVPQSRPRLFILAVDENAAIPRSVVSAGPSAAWHPASIIRAHNLLPQSLQDRWIWWNLPEPNVELKSLDQLVELEPEVLQWHTAAETQRLLSLMAPRHRQKVMLAQKTGVRKVGTIYRRTRDGEQRAEVRFDGIAGCLRTPSGGSSLQTLMIVEGPTIRSRLLSPREAARLMGLDDRYLLPTLSSEAYKLLGDGVAVPVVSHLARNIFEPVTAVAKQALINAA